MTAGRFWEVQVLNNVRSLNSGWKYIIAKITSLFLCGMWRKRGNLHVAIKRSVYTVHFLIITQNGTCFGCTRQPPSDFMFQKQVKWKSYSCSCILNITNVPPTCRLQLYDFLLIYFWNVKLVVVVQSKHVAFWITVIKCCIGGMEKTT